eukprot:1618791-Rhodomonas_salina.1
MPPYGAKAKQWSVEGGAAIVVLEWITLECEVFGRVRDSSVCVMRAGGSTVPRRQRVRAVQANIRRKLHQWAQAPEDGVPHAASVGGQAL